MKKEIGQRSKVELTVNIYDTKINILYQLICIYFEMMM